MAIPKEILRDAARNSANAPSSGPSGGDDNPIAGIIGGIIMIAVVLYVGNMVLEFLSKKYNQLTAEKIYINNQCNHKIYIALHYKDPNSSDWETAYWWNFNAGERSSLDHKGETVKTSAKYVYYYAYANGARYVWEGGRGDPSYAVGQEYYRFRESKKMEIKLICPN